MIVGGENTKVSQSQDIVVVNEDFEEMEYGVNPGNLVPYTIEVHLNLSYSKSEGSKVKALLKALAALHSEVQPKPPTEPHLVCEMVNGVCNVCGSKE